MAAPTGYLPIGRSAPAATLGMVKNAAVMRMMIFMILIPLHSDTRAGEPTPLFAPAVELFPPAEYF